MKRIRQSLECPICQTGLEAIPEGGFKCPSCEVTFDYEEPNPILRAAGATGFTVRSLVDLRKTIEAAKEQKHHGTA